MKDKNINAVIGSKIASMRKAKGLTQQKLADKIGISRRNLAYYETQTGRMPVDILTRIAEVLSVSVDEIISLKVSKTDGRSLDGKFWGKWKNLSGDEKKTVSKVVDSLLAAHTS